MNDALDRPAIHGRPVNALLLLAIVLCALVVAGCGQKEDALGPNGQPEARR